MDAVELQQALLMVTNTITYQKGGEQREHPVEDLYIQDISPNCVSIRGNYELLSAVEDRLTHALTDQNYNYVRNGRELIVGPMQGDFDQGVELEQAR